MLTLDVGLKCRDILRRQGVTVIMTRDRDVNLGLYDRAHVARDNQADAFISIHFNGDPNPGRQGTETWIYTGTSSTSNSHRLAELVQHQVLSTTSYEDRGIKVGSLGVLNPYEHYLSTAACLVEVSFITDPNDENRLVDQGYRFRLAESISVAAYDYITKRFEIFDLLKIRATEEEYADADKDA